MLSFLSPCVLPLVPAYLSMVSGLSAAELAALRPAAHRARPGRRWPAGGRSWSGARIAVVRTEPSPAETEPGPSPSQLRHERSRLLRGILAFIAGFTVVFTILGASASSVGRLFLTHQRDLETVSGILIVRVRRGAGGHGRRGRRSRWRLAGERRFAVRPSVLGAWAPPVMGMAFAFAWTPCIGPVLGSVLALAAGTGGSATGGIALLLAYSLGLGVPFLLSGLAFGRMTDLLARVRGRLRIVDLVGGAILIAFGVLLLTGNVDVLSAHISTWLRDLHLSRLSTS